MRVFHATLALFVMGSACLRADEPSAKSEGPDLSEFKTVATATTTEIRGQVVATLPTIPQKAYLGIVVEEHNKKELVVKEVDTASPAAKAGVRKDDVIVKIDDTEPATAKDFRRYVGARDVGKTLKLEIRRDKETLSPAVKLGRFSHPLGGTPRRRAVLGIKTAQAAEGVRITSLTPGASAWRAGLRKDDVIVRIESTATSTPDRLRIALSRKRPDDKIRVAYKRGDKESETTVLLDASGIAPPRISDWRPRRRKFTKDAYRLAVVPIEFADIKRSRKITTEHWDEALFSANRYNKKNATGQTVYGSVNDYYREISYGQFSVTGKVFEHVAVSKKRAEYATKGSRSTTLFDEALASLRKRDNDAVLDNFDGIFFIYSGKRAPSERMGLYWPHRASLSDDGKRWNYIICPEGGSIMSSISIIAHEFGHLLGLPDLYAIRGSTGPEAEGVGLWCTMSTGHGRRGRPVHFSAWCKEQLDWIRPALLDPRVKQKLILSPAGTSSKEFYKILIRPDGSEYLLLENRIKKGFDQDLQGEGLLIWRVTGNRPVLQESHGVTDTSGPRRYPDSVPYPSKANNAYTPNTTPSSKSARDGAWPVYITNVRRLDDGRITFYLGYEFY